MISFAGWDLPLQYKGVIHEHNQVRKSAGVFDVSHMGRIAVNGEQAEVFLDYLSANRIEGKSDFTATYTVLPNAEGRTVDDVIVYKQNGENFFIVVNGSTRQKDLAHLNAYAKKFNVSITHQYDVEGILAVQGPLAKAIGSKLFPELSSLSPMKFLQTKFQGKELILSETGYTGAGGFEIYAPQDLIVAIWDLLLKEGAGGELESVGLGARDTLRLEMGYALYGHELSDSISVVESVSAWTFKPKGRSFLGKESCIALQNSSCCRTAYGIICKERGAIPREGCLIFKEGKEIGHVTSGTQSITLGKSIGLILSNEKLALGELVEVQIRNSTITAEVTLLPFIHRG